MKKILASLFVILFFSIIALSAKEPIFVAVKIDGPVHDPEHGTFWYGPFSEGVAVFDVDGDGVLDITCGANWYQGPNWKKHANFRDNAVNLGEFVVNCGEFAVDVDGDGKTDLISAGWMSNGVWWYKNPGKVGEKWPATKITSSDHTEGLIVEDLDGDGDADVLVDHWDNTGDQGVTWIENLGGAKFDVHVIGKKGDQHGVGLGDLDGDGRKDIITPAGWYKAPQNRAKGEWTFQADYQAPIQLGIRIIVFDVNGDGLNDLIYGRGHDYGLAWMEQKRAADKRTFETHMIEESFGQFHTLTLADVNQDGNLDLVTGKRLRGHEGNDPSSFDPMGVFWYDIQGGKFVRHVLSYNHAFSYPGGDTRNPPPNFAIGTGMNINVVDINKDGKVDIVVAGKSGLYMFENRGAPPTGRLDGKPKN
jgi:hypothetical protein